ncbi:MAG: hypothetical protein Q8N47_28565 [Bryobacterales bacterium]|nr:hypothetical protein [Bryobacterales bacterium]
MKEGIGWQGKDEAEQAGGFEAGDGPGFEVAVGPVFAVVALAPLVYVAFRYDAGREPLATDGHG